jgi:hypothetical protein
MEPVKNYLMARAMAPLIRIVGGGMSGNTGNSAEGASWFLDPTSVLVALAINSYKPIGTKLSVIDGTVQLQDVSMLQGTIRAIYGESKVNIKVLHFPIINACRHFAKVRFNDEGMMLLFQRAKRGLENLWHTYHDDRETLACLNKYMNIMQTTMTKGALAIDMLDVLVSLDIADLEKETAIADVRKGVSDKLQRVWDDNKLGIVVGLIRELESSAPAMQGSLFNSLDSFMDMMHVRCKQITATI